MFKLYFILLLMFLVSCQHSSHVKSHCIAAPFFFTNRKLAHTNVPNSYAEPLVCNTVIGKNGHNQNFERGLPATSIQPSQESGKLAMGDFVIYLQVIFSATENKSGLAKEINSSRPEKTVRKRKRALEKISLEKIMQYENEYPELFQVSNLEQKARVALKLKDGKLAEYFQKIFEQDSFGSVSEVSRPPQPIYKALRSGEVIPFGVDRPFQEQDRSIGWKKLLQTIDGKVSSSNLVPRFLDKDYKSEYKKNLRYAEENFEPVLDRITWEPSGLSHVVARHLNSSIDSRIKSGDILGADVPTQFLANIDVLDLLGSTHVRDSMARAYFNVDIDGTLRLSQNFVRIIEFEEPIGLIQEARIKKYHKRNINPDLSLYVISRSGRFGENLMEMQKRDVSQEEWANSTLYEKTHKLVIITNHLGDLVTCFPGELHNIQLKEN